jgi:hypothetical protein
MTLHACSKKQKLVTVDTFIKWTFPNDHIRKATAMKSQGIAIPFFTEAQWTDARAVMEDGATFHDSYTEFVHRVQQAEMQLRREGKATIRVYIEPRMFADWCRANGCKVNAESRSHFAAWKAAQTDSGRKN